MLVNLIHFNNKILRFIVLIGIFFLYFITSGKNRKLEIDPVEFIG